jgi:hypothetical protein
MQEEKTTRRAKKTLTKEAGGVSVSSSPKRNHPTEAMRNETMTQHHFSARDFSRKVRNALTKRGLTITTATWLPGPNCDFTNGEMGYLLSDGRLLRWADVNKVAAV